MKSAKKKKDNLFSQIFVEKANYLLGTLVLIISLTFLVISILKTTAKPDIKTIESSFNQLQPAIHKDSSILVYPLNGIEQKSDSININNKIDNSTLETIIETLDIEESDSAPIVAEIVSVKEDIPSNIESTSEAINESVIPEKMKITILKENEILYSMTSSTCSHDNGSSSEDSWLIRHQEKDGHWASGKHEGNDSHEMDCAVSAMALLSILGSGHTDRVGKYKSKVKLALQWLIDNQRPDGSWGASNYVNGICTMAISEARGMNCGGEAVKNSANIAVDFLLKEQNVSGFFDYSGPSTTDDMSVTGWCILALKSAILAGIKESEIKEAFLKCGALLDNTDGTNDNTESTKGLSWYLPGIKGSGYPGGSCQAITMLIRQYIGWERSAPWLIAAADGQISQLPKDYQSLDIYRVYFADAALFQQGGKQWSAWRSQVHKIIIDSQRKDGDFKGSWDNNGSPTDKGGRVLNTAILNMTHVFQYCYYSILEKD